MTPDVQILIRYAASDAGRDTLREAVDELAAVMLPHLQREEDDAMPIVSQCMSKAEWDDWDRRFNLDTRSLAERSFGGLWLMDGTMSPTVTWSVP